VIGVKVRIRNFATIPETWDSQGQMESMMGGEYEAELLGGKSTIVVDGFYFMEHHVHFINEDQQ
jgi:hypothetical protein